MSAGSKDSSPGRYIVGPETVDCASSTARDARSSMDCENDGHLWLQACPENSFPGSWDSEGSSGDCSSPVVMPSASQSPGISSAGIINSASPVLFVRPACEEHTHLLAKGFGPASACTDQGQPPLEQPDCIFSPQHLVLLSSGPSRSLLIEHQGHRLLSLVSAFRVWRRMEQPELQPARLMVEKVVRKIAERCRAETDLGLEVFCLIVDEKNFLKTATSMK
ncbi:uncharacterized protein LOC116793609 [Chiroxiphia lanceolata]|uniref:uncharacterized protein LOC116793609 n=1 Tax=Chiroxiphia lanceolata TaxID=296741 RepID=UPI0013CE4A4D|nr:uncharacterized protein LOC116793609 [Chiroxiphia lanceolata]